MEPVLYTPRLKLTLLTNAPRGSREFNWIHELRSNEAATRYSIHGTSKTPEDTEKQLQRMGVNTDPAAPKRSDGPVVPMEKSYRINYAVHEILDADATTSSENQEEGNDEMRKSRCIGHIGLGPRGLDLPPSLFPPSVQDSKTLVVELGYMFLPTSWGRGFASEAIGAVLAACRDSKNREFWTAGGKAYEKVYCRAIVNDENPGSQKVLQKCGVEKLGVWTWEGEAVYLMGRWIDRADLWILGTWIVG